MSRSRAALLAGLVLLVTVQCEGPFDFDFPTTGAVRASVTTNGADLDLDGYTLAFDGGAEQPIGSVGSVLRDSLAPGPHTVELRGWEANCQPNGMALRTVAVEAGDTGFVSFTVNCAATGVQVEITTVGIDVDGDGYTLSVDGALALSVPLNVVRSVTRLTIGTHVVTLGGLAGNCSVAGDNPRTITIATHDLVLVQFAATCTSVTGGVRVSSVTTGDSLDVDGFAVSLDGGSPLPLGRNAAIVVNLLSGGDHTVELGGVAENCSVAEPNPATVHILVGQAVRYTADMTFHVSCHSTSGTLRVTTTTLGVDQDLDGYSVFLDDTYYPSAYIGSNDTLELSLPEGPHYLALAGFNGNCAVRNGPVRGPNIVRQTVTQVDYIIDCTALGRIELTTITTGPDPDPNGYGVVVAFRYVPMQANATTTLTGIYPGDYAIQVSDYAFNCAPIDIAPDTVHVSSGATSAVTISVACTTARELAMSWQGDIQLVKSNGAGVTALTATPAFEDRPTWSPDGQRLAFRSNRDGHAEIYAMDANGANQVRLTTGTAVNLSPAWSPDGTRIAFVSERDGNREIYVMNADGTNQTRFTNNAAVDDQPAWSPDGSTLAFVSNRTGQDVIHVMPAGGGAATPLTSTSSASSYGILGEPAWSPDGSKIAFSAQVNCGYGFCQRDVFVVNADGSGLHALMTGTNDSRNPAWTPDGQWVAFDDRYCDYYYYYYGCTEPYIAAVRANGTDYRLIFYANGAEHPSWRP